MCDVALRCECVAFEQTCKRPLSLNAPASSRKTNCRWRRCHIVCTSARAPFQVGVRFTTNSTRASVVAIFDRDRKPPVRRPSTPCIIHGRATPDKQIMLQYSSALCAHNGKALCSYFFFFCTFCKTRRRQFALRRQLIGLRRLHDAIQIFASISTRLVYWTCPSSIPDAHCTAHFYLLVSPNLT